MQTRRIPAVAVLVLGLAMAAQACDQGTTTPTPDSFTLTVSLDGLGFGSVSSDPAGISCDTAGAGCTATLEEGTEVTLTATADSGSEFIGWGTDGTANPLTFTMSGDRDVTAEFDNPDLATEAVGAGGGTVTSRDSAVSLVFPAGALSGDEDITIERVDPADLDTAWADLRNADDIASAYQMGPEGLQFAVPVEVRLATRATEGSADSMVADLPEMATAEADTAAAVDSMEVVIDPASGESRVSGYIHHFSPIVERRGATRFTWTGLPTGPVQVGDLVVVTVQVSAPYELVPDTDAIPEISGPAQNWNRTATGLSITYEIACTGIGTADALIRAIYHRPLGTDSPDRVSVMGFSIDCVGSTLTVTTSGQGVGSVTAPRPDRTDGAGIACGAIGNICEEEYPRTGEATLTATPDADSYLAGWTVDGQEVPDDGSGQLTLTMDTDHTVDARFEPIVQEELSVSLAGDGDGTVTSDPAGIDCTKTGTTVSGSCAAMFDLNSTVTLTATDPDGSTLTDWSGDGTTNALGQRLVQIATAAAVGMTFPIVPGTATVLDLASLAVYYLEAMSLVSLRFPFAQPAADLAWQTTGEACPTVLVAGDWSVLAVDACTGALVQQYDFDFSFYNAFALPRPEGETGDNAILATGQNYAFFWVDDTGAVTSQIGQVGWGTVPDAAPINGDPADGIALVRDDGFGQMVYFVRYDPAKGYHDFTPDYVGVTTTPPNAQSVFAAGLPAGDPTGMPEEMLVVGDDGTDGVLYYIETVSDTYPTFQQVGTLGGSNPRRIRCDLASGICAVSDFANSLVTVVTWSGTGLPTIVGSTTAGQIASGPVGLDVYGRFIVTAGYNDNQYSIIEVDAGGAVVNVTTAALPAGCTAPGHAVFLRDAANTILVSCNGSQAIVRIPNAF